jgi:flagellar basal-body rod protein FlgB
MKVFMPDSIKLLQNLLDYCSVKNKVIAKNLANIGTEKYNREDVEFKDMLNENIGEVLKTDDPRHISMLRTDNSFDSKYEVTEDKSTDNDSGVNNVNIEREMSEMAENALRFRFASKKVSDYYKSIQSVIKGGV